MTVKNIPDHNVTSYDTVYAHHQYKDLVSHFPAAHLTLHHFQAVRSPSFHIEYQESQASSRLKMYLTVLIDELAGTDLGKDYCLGAYNHGTRSIQCVSNSSNLIDLQITNYA